MSSSYARQVPHDASGEPIVGAPPAFISLHSTAATNTVSSTISLNAGTTFVEISAIGAPVAVKWGPTSVITATGTENFDDVVPAGALRQFAPPVSVMGTSSLVGANIANGLYNSVSVKTFGTSASVFTTEY